MIKLDNMVLKTDKLCYRMIKIRSKGFEGSQLGTAIQKSSHMVLKGVIWFEMSDLGTQCKNLVKWSCKESIE